jgi:L-alanine-DL-glutamate epimerase-like enolase superfamily enzyme
MTKEIAMARTDRVAGLTTLACGAGWRNYHFVKLTTEGGVTGWSEFDEGFGSPGVGAVITALSSRVVGKSVMEHELVRADLQSVTRPASGGVVGQALGAIENALLDAKAKTLGVPCHVLLGGKIRDRMRVYWSHCVSWRAGRIPHYEPPITDIAGVRQIGAEVAARGFTALKTNIWGYEPDGRITRWAPGFGNPFAPALNMERKVIDGLRLHLETLQESAGRDVDVLIDLNFNAKTEGYLQVLRRTRDLPLFWVEIDTLDPNALAWLRAQSPHPIASCETLIGVQAFLPYLRAQAVDVAIVDVPWNGAWQSIKIAAAAEAHEVNVACHNFYGHLCTMMNAHFCAVVPNLRIMEVDIDRIAADAELFTHAPHFEDGHLVLSDRPGWGTEPDEAALRRHPPVQGASGLLGLSKATVTRA